MICIKGGLRLAKLPICIFTQTIQKRHPGGERPSNEKAEAGQILTSAVRGLSMAGWIPIIRKKNKNGLKEWPQRCDVWG